MHFRNESVTLQFPQCLSVLRGHGRQRLPSPPRNTSLIPMKDNELWHRFRKTETDWRKLLKKLDRTAERTMQLASGGKIGTDGPACYLVFVNIPLPKSFLLSSGGSTISACEIIWQHQHTSKFSVNFSVTNSRIMKNSNLVVISVRRCTIISH